MRRLALLPAVLAIAAHARADNSAVERALKDAASRVAPSVARIETAGGADRAKPDAPGQRPGERLGRGPTTGLVVAADGYVITSSFNFAGNPSDIFVTVPGRPRAVAKVVAQDASRYLTLLKIDESNLPVPAAVPKAEFRVGQWAVALGRALNADANEPPSPAAGIVSAVGRIFGRAVQTDAKTSPVNYGGPLVARDGRVLGVVVPANPESEGDTAGLEWYDSGIGFAVPLEDVFAALPRLREGKTLRRGKMGFSLKEPGEQYLVPPTVASVPPDTPAAKAGLKPGDVILTINGEPAPHASRMAHLLGPLYEGDAVTLVVRRDGKELTLPAATLAGVLAAPPAAYLGVQAAPADGKPGVVVRHVFPDSPATKGKLVAGDRLAAVLLKEAPRPVPLADRDALAALLARTSPGDEVKFVVSRAGKNEEIAVTLAERSAEAPPAPEPPVAAEPKPGDAPTGLIRKEREALGRSAWLYVPPTYRKEEPHGVVVWLHDAGRGGKDADDVVNAWKDFCAKHRYLIAAPKSSGGDRWLASEASDVTDEVRKVVEEYSVDPNRVAAHGMGAGGTMALYCGFFDRGLFRGVAATGAALASKPKDVSRAEPLAFFLAAGANDPALPEVRATKAALEELKHPVAYREIADFGREYLDAKTLADLQNWLAALDRL